MSTTKRHRIDRLGIISSGLCAIHCAALPLLISFGVIGSFNSEVHQIFEWVILSFSLVLGSWSIINAIQTHGNIFPQIVIAAGALILIIGLFVFDNHTAMSFGGFLLLAGHFANWRLLGSSKS